MRFLYRREAAGFSLMEVVIATGVFALAIVAVIGLVGVPSRATREVFDSTVAARLAEGVNQELARLAAAVGFPKLVEDTTPSKELFVYATADGSRLVESSLADLADVGVPSVERYFLLEIMQLSAPAPTDACLPLQIRVQWPYMLPDGREAGETQRSSFSFNTAILR